MVSYVRSLRFATVFLFLFLLGATRVTYASASLLFNGYVQTLSTALSAASLTLVSPAAMVVDPSGDVFIADTGHSRIVEVNAQGSASVLLINGLTLSSPTGLAVDGAGNLYVADTGNNRVVEINSSGAGSVVSTGSVTLSVPKGVALDLSGDILISDTGHNQIVEVTSGSGAAVLSITVSSGLSTLTAPRGLSVDTAGNIFIADTGNSRVVKVAAGGTTGVVVSIGELDPALSSPSAVVADRVGNVFIADPGNNRIVEVDTAGTGTILLNTYVLQETTLSGPLGVAIDVFGAVYVADTGHNQALIVYPYLDGDPETENAYTSSLNRSAVGFGHITLGSGTPNSLTLSFAVGSPVSGLGSVKVLTSGTQGLDFQIVTGADTACSNLTSLGEFCTVEVNFLPVAPGLRRGAVVLYDADSNPVLTLPLYGFGDAPVAVLAPNTGTKISTGSVVTGFPFQVALDGAGNIYDANDEGNVVKIPAGGGSASMVSPNGYTFGSEVDGVALDGAGNLFISDHLNSRIIVITPGGVTSVLTINGLGTPLSYPTGLAFDGAGNLYISDYENGRVVEVSSLFVAGSSSVGIGTVIGTGTYQTTSLGITGVAVDPMGNIYIPDGYAADPSRVIKVTATGAVSLLTPTGITFSRPGGVTADGMGNIYVADGGNNRIVEITTAGVASVLALSGLPSPTTLGSPFSVTVDPFGNLYIPDASNNRVLFVNVSGGALSFPSTARGATSTPKTATVANLGNEALIFSANPTYTANFAENSGDTNPCTSSTSLLAGMDCDISVEFTPQSVGNLSAGITVTNNALNVAGSTEQVSVSGTSFSSADPTTTTLTVNPTSLASGQAVTITALVADTPTPSHIPTGTVSFTDTLGSTTITLSGGSAVSLASGRATLTGAVLSGVGTHIITATYAGVSGTFATSSKTATVLVKATPTIAITSSMNPVLVTSPVTFTATLTVTAGATTGSVSFYDGTTLLGAVSIAQEQGTARPGKKPAPRDRPVSKVPAPSSATVSYTTSSLATGSHAITAVYGGDSNFASVSSSQLVEMVQDFTLTTATGSGGSNSSMSQTVPAGGAATYTLALGPTNGTTFPAPVTLSVSGLPTGATATITPQVIPAGSALTNITLMVQLPASTASLDPKQRPRRGMPGAFWSIVLLPFAGRLRRAGKKLSRTVCLVLMVGAGIVATVGLSSCGSGNGFFGQQKSIYTLTLKATAGAVSHSTALTLTVE